MNFSVEGVILAALTAFIGFLFLEYRKLKAQAEKEVETRTPEQWHWFWNSLAATFVKAAYQLFPSNETENMLIHVQVLMYNEFEKHGFILDDATKEKIRAIIEAAVFDFYRDLEERKTTIA